MMCLLWKARFRFCDWVVLINTQLFLRGGRSSLFIIYFFFKQQHTHHIESLTEVTMKNAIVDIACDVAWGPLFLIVEFYS